MIRKRASWGVRTVARKSPWRRQHAQSPVRHLLLRGAASSAAAPPPEAAAAGKRTALRMLCGFGVAFNALMLYWFGGAVVGMLNQPVTEEFTGVVVPTGNFAIPSEAEEAVSVEP